MSTLIFFTHSHCERFRSLQNEKRSVTSYLSPQKSFRIDVLILKKKHVCKEQFHNYITSADNQTRQQRTRIGEPETVTRARATVRGKYKKKKKEKRKNPLSSNRRQKEYYYKGKTILYQIPSAAGVYISCIDFLHLCVTSSVGRPPRSAAA